LPKAIADEMNGHNDATRLLAPSQVAAIATLQHEDKNSCARSAIAHVDRSARGAGARTYPTETFFLADFAPCDAGELAARLAGQEILVKALNDVCLGAGYMRVTTARRKSSLRP
jgi:histidinol-phosphate aminotransferase